MLQGTLKQVLHLRIYMTNISLDWGPLSKLEDDYYKRNKTEVVLHTDFN